MTQLQLLRARSLARAFRQSGLPIFGEEGEAFEVIVSATISAVRGCRAIPAGRLRNDAIFKTVTRKLSRTKGSHRAAAQEGET